MNREHQKVERFMRYLNDLKKKRVQVFIPQDVACSLKWMTTMECSHHLKHIRGIARVRVARKDIGLSRDRMAYEFTEGEKLEYIL